MVIMNLKHLVFKQRSYLDAIIRNWCTNQTGSLFLNLTNSFDLLLFKIYDFLLSIL